MWRATTHDTRGSDGGGIGGDGCGGGTTDVTHNVIRVQEGSGGRMAVGVADVVTAVAAVAVTGGGCDEWRPLFTPLLVQLHVNAVG